jgi:hypothetical protein
MRASRVLVFCLVAGCAGGKVEPTAESKQPASQRAMTTSQPEPLQPPPLPPAPQLRAPAVPEAPAFFDPSLLAVIRMRDPLNEMAQFGFDGARLSQMFGMDVSDVHPGPAAGFVFAPPGHEDNNPAWLALLPVADKTALAKELRRRVPAARALGKNLLLASDAGTLRRAVANSKAIEALAQAALGDDVSVQMNSSVVLQRYGPSLQKAFEEANSQMRAQGGADQGAVAKWLLDAFSGIDSTTLLLDLTPNAYELTWINRAKVPARDEALDAEVPPDLPRFLPKSHLRVQATGQLLGTGVAFTKGFAGLFGATNPKLGEIMSDSIAGWSQIARNTEMAYGLSFSPEKLIHWIPGERVPARRSRDREPDQRFREDARAQGHAPARESGDTADPLHRLRAVGRRGVPDASARRCASRDPLGLSTARRPRATSPD